MRHLLIAVLLLSGTQLARAEMIPDRCTLSGHFFVDRWGQPVLGSLFVSSDLTKKLAPYDLKRITVVTKSVKQVGLTYDGAGSIEEIDSISALPMPPAKLKLSVDHKSVEYGQPTSLRLLIENNSNNPIKVDGRDLKLFVTVHRASDPDQNNKVDMIYCNVNRTLCAQSDPGYRSRATCECRLNVSHGEIIIRHGEPSFRGKYEPDHTVIAAGKSQELTYTIGDDFSVNEYELRVEFVHSPRNHEDSFIAISPPISFDVVKKR